MSLAATLTLFAPFLLTCISFPTETEVTEWPWTDSWFDKQQIKLGPANADNARQVLVLSDDGPRAVCDDLWTDKSALALCKMEGFQYGRRTSVRSDVEFAYSSVSCYEQYDYVDLSSYQKPLFVIANAQCSYTPYSTTTLPCSPSQAAAVFCYDDPWYNVFHNVQLSADSRHFSIKFLMSFVKLGEFHSALAADPLTSVPGVAQYSAEACGNEVMLSLEESLRENAFFLRGEFDENCDECLSVMLDGEALFNNICVNEDV